MVVKTVGFKNLTTLSGQHQSWNSPASTASHLATQPFPPAGQQQPQDHLPGLWSQMHWDLTLPTSKSAATA